MADGSPPAGAARRHGREQSAAGDRRRRSTARVHGGHISVEPRINERIRVPEVRLVGPNGEQVGIVSVNDALRLAQEADLDLVEVAPTARPPVCKLMDYGKFKYESALKARESRKNQAQTVIKEIKLRPKIDPHDYGTKKGHVERFLKQGDKVKVTIMFRGREQSRPELGFRLLQQLAGDVEELGFVESQPKQDGRNMIMVIGPHKKKSDAKSERAAERSAQAHAQAEAQAAAEAAAQAGAEAACSVLLAAADPAADDQAGGARRDRRRTAKPVASGGAEPRGRGRRGGRAGRLAAHRARAVTAVAARREPMAGLTYLTYGPRARCNGAQAHCVRCLGTMENRRASRHAAIWRRRRHAEDEDAQRCQQAVPADGLGKGDAPPRQPGSPA